MSTNLVSNLSDDDNLSFIPPAKSHAQTPEESALFAELLFQHGVTRPLIDPAQPDTVYCPPEKPRGSQPEDWQELDRKMDALEQRLADLDVQLDALDRGMDELETLLQKIEPPAPDDAWVAHHLRQYGFALSAPAVPEHFDSDRPEPEYEEPGETPVFFPEAEPPEETNPAGAGANLWAEYFAQNPDDIPNDDSRGDEWYDDEPDFDGFEGDDFEDGYFPDDDVIDVGEGHWYAGEDSIGSEMPDDLPEQKPEKPLIMLWCAVLFTVKTVQPALHIHVVPLSDQDYADFEHLADCSIPHHTETTIYGMNVRVVNLLADEIAIEEMIVLEQVKAEMVEALNREDAVPTTLKLYTRQPGDHNGN